MRVKILGSAAGGAFPQWNCACANCRAVSAGTFRGKPRTRPRLRSRKTDARGFLLGASPDLRAQIEATPELHPREACASRPSRAWCWPAPISTTSSDCFCCANFNRCAFTPRPRFAAFSAKTTPCSACCIEFQIKPSGPILNRERNFLCAMLKARIPVSAAGRGRWAVIILPIVTANGSRNFPPAKHPWASSSIRLPARALAYMPAVPQIDDCVARATRRLRRPALRWHILERRRTDSHSGQRTNRAADGPRPGRKCAGQSWRRVRRPRKIFLHINNTNPMLDEASPEYREVRGAGWEIAEDGWQFDL